MDSADCPLHMFLLLALQWSVLGCHLQYHLLHHSIHPLMTLYGSFCCHHLPGKKVLYVFIFGSYTENIWITICNIFKMCMDMYAFFFIWYMWNLFGSCTDMHIMYGLTMTFVLLLGLVNPWVLFVPLLTGFGVWSFCSASPCLTGLSLSNCWCMAHHVSSLPICTCSFASCATKSFCAGK